jgi:hypothetical protein
VDDVDGRAVHYEASSYAIVESGTAERFWAVIAAVQVTPVIDASRSGH